MLYSGRVAVSRIFVKYGMMTADATALETAVGLTPNDAEAHYASGALSNYSQQPGEALKQLEVAVSLRPRDYVFWLDLGMTRDELGDRAGALMCLNEAVRLAPYYAKPLWQRGNVLFREGAHDDKAFVDLRRAAASNPELLPALIDLAWGASGKDSRITEQLLQVQSSNGHYALALFFARHGKADEALSHYRLAGAISREKRQDLVKALLASQAIVHAYEVWGSKNTDARSLVYDGGFESVLSRDETGFGWRVAAGQPGIAFSLDTRQPQTGARSLRIDFTGHPAPAVELISQLIPAEPSSRYRVSFAAQTIDIVTGGPLTIIAKDAREQKPLGKSVFLPARTDGWRSFSFEFATGPQCNAVVVALRREDCSGYPCPIFGSLNLDSFSLQKLD